MICIIHFTKNDTYKKELMLILLLHLMNLSISFLVVDVPSVPYLLTPENSDAQLTCMFKDNVRTGSGDNLNVYWVLLGSDKKITHGISSNWNNKTRVGKTTLHMHNVTKEKEGKYRCIVWVSGSFDYKYVELGTTDGMYGGKGGVEIIPQHSDMWNGPPLKLNCSFKFSNQCTMKTTVYWWKLNTTTYIWDQQVSGVSGGFGTREPVVMSHQELDTIVTYGEYPKWTL
ncbi:MPPV-085 Ig-like domain protein [Magpiepox virus 2]|nr:MPPV-085 Ig-like domain protein [Magpiepox virus 2]